MTRHDPFDASAQAMGYLYQCRYALYASLKHLSDEVSFSVGVEALDDISFHSRGRPTELLQTKHHIQRAAKLTDASPDLWKTIRIWSERIANEISQPDTLLFLITTAKSGEGSTTSFMSAGEHRNPEVALQRLISTAQSSISQENALAYNSFKQLSHAQQKLLVKAIHILDGAPCLSDLNDLLRKQVYMAVDRKNISSYLERLEGWWYQRIIDSFVHKPRRMIDSEEIEMKINSLREQFKADNLPIDEDIMNATIAATGYEDRIFIRQLNLIEVNARRVVRAINNWYRAFNQRSRWVREDLLAVEELQRYERQLIEEWEIVFDQMRDKIGDTAAEEEKIQAAQVVYSWIESSEHPRIRPACTERAIARGSYQMLADNLRVGWHPEFKRKLKEVLESVEVTDYGALARETN